MIQPIAPHVANTMYTTHDRTSIESSLAKSVLDALENSNFLLVYEPGDPANAELKASFESKRVRSWILILALCLTLQNVVKPSPFFRAAHPHREDHGHILGFALGAM